MKGDIPVSDERLVEKTGQGWDAWFEHLDAWGGAEAGHTATAAHLHKELGVSAWYAQTITTAYELERGLRAPGQRSSGAFEVSVRRTVAADPVAAFAAMSRPDGWNAWLTSGASFDLREGERYQTDDEDTGRFLLVDPPRRLRMTWEHPKHAPGGIVELAVRPAGDERSTVEVRHSNIANEADYKGLKDAWRYVMDRLKAHLAEA